MRRRGDNIPNISDYAHWNEDAKLMWYQENRYDMEYADEIIEDDYDRYADYEPEPFSTKFHTEAEARAFAANLRDSVRDRDIYEWKDLWFVDHYEKDAHELVMRAWTN